MQRTELRVGIMSSKNNDINVWSWFSTKDRKYRDVESDLQKLLNTYKSLNFSEINM